MLLQRLPAESCKRRVGHGQPVHEKREIVEDATEDKNIDRRTSSFFAFPFRVFPHIHCTVCTYQCGTVAETNLDGKFVLFPLVSPFSFFSPNFFLDRVTRPVPFRRGGSLSCFLSSHPVHRKGPPLAYRGRETVNSPLGTEITLSSVLGEERKVPFERIRDPLMRAPTN